MKLTLKRLELSSQSTIGRLAIDGEDHYWTLEDVVRYGPKVPGQTAIPAGTYRVIITPSPRFKRPLPLLLDVPGFDGVRIHPGNTASDTEGCILVGMGKSPDQISQSRIAFDALFAKIDAACSAGESVYITIS
jgi:hypothetical protein